MSSSNNSAPGGTAWRRQLVRRLLAWFDGHARDLPWRQTRTPYRVWISEIMLQQTQVVTVVSYFERFVARFPTVADLAAADEQEVLRHWEGLGYYRRARQLHAAARRIMAEHGGEFPHEFPAVRSLPGIGRYTAGAILSIALDQRWPILEANTTRVLSRLLAYRDDPQRSAGQRQLWALAEALLPDERSGDLNQALMELGSELCTPRAPRCLECPVAALCPTCAQGLQDVIPRPRARPATIDVREVAVVLLRRGRVLLRRCGTGERWAGLWDFPRCPVAATDPAERETEVARQLRQLVGYRIAIGRHLATIKHGVTRYRITLDCYQGTARGAAGPRHDVKWVAVDELEQHPLSVSGRRIAQLLPPPAGDRRAR